MSYSSSINELEVLEETSWKGVEKSYSNLQRARKTRNKSLILQMEKAYEIDYNTHQKILDDILYTRTKHLDNIVASEV